MYTSSFNLLTSYIVFCRNNAIWGRVRGNIFWVCLQTPRKNQNERLMVSFQVETNEPQGNWLFMCSGLFCFCRGSEMTWSCTDGSSFCTHGTGIFVCNWRRRSYLRYMLQISVNIVYFLQWRDFVFKFMNISELIKKSNIPYVLSWYVD